MANADLGMRPGKPCMYFAGKWDPVSMSGCKIYEDRPKTCQKFLCSYRKYPNRFPEDMRPNISGVVIFHGPQATTIPILPLHGKEVIVAVPVGQKIPEKSLKWVKEYAEKCRLPLLYHEYTIEEGEFTGSRTWIYAPASFFKQLSKDYERPNTTKS